MPLIVEQTIFHLYKQTYWSGDRFISNIISIRFSQIIQTTDLLLHGLKDMQFFIKYSGIQGVFD